MLGLRLSPLVKQYIIVLTVNLNMINIGMMLGWGSPMLVKLSDEEATPLARPLTNEEGSWVMSIYFLGGFLAVVMPLIVKLLGRKYTIISNFILNFAARLLFIFGNSFWTILGARALAGIGNTIVMNTVPIYSAEIANKEIRGSLGTISMVLLSLGYLIIVVAGPHLSYLACNVMTTICVVVTTLPSLFLPETPYGLFLSGQKDKSLKVLTSIRGSQDLAYEELSTYSSNTNISENRNSKVFTNTFMKALILLIILAIFSELTGHNVVAYNLQTICIVTNTSVSPALMATIVSTIAFLAVCLVPFVTDRFGRKPILILGALGTSVGMFGLGTFFYLKDENYQVNGVINLVPIASLIFVDVSYNAGFVSLFSLLASELFDGPRRSVGISTVNFCYNLFIFTNVKCFPLVLEKLGPAVTFWNFGTFCLAMFIFVILFLPETKGRTFLEIQECLGAKNIYFETKMRQII